MRGNPLSILNPGEIKLLKLYKQHELISLEIINLLNLELVSINEENALINKDGLNNNALINNNASNLEEYSLIEKGLVTKLFELNRVIKSYESAVSVYSPELDQCRTKASVRQKEIGDLSKMNRKLLKFSLEKMASLLDLFIRKSTYVSSSAGQIPPQFIDIRI